MRIGSSIWKCLATSIAAAVLVSLAGAACAGTISLGQCFPTYQGEFGLYAQQYDVATQTMSLLPQVSTALYSVHTQSWDIPYVKARDTKANIGVHPFFNNGVDRWAVVSYKTAAECDLAYDIWCGSNGTVGCRVFVGNVADQSTTLDMIEPPGGVATGMNGVCHLAANQWFHIAVDARGNMGGDSTSIWGTLSPTQVIVPEPGSLAVLATGIGGMLLAIRRRTR